MAKQSTHGKRRRPRKDNSKGLKQIEANAAGIDIGASSHYVAVPADRDEEPVREFPAFTSGLHALADWLAACGVTTVAMESTGVYWVPLYDLLEERGFKVLLVNARHVRNVPGRKSDVLDCQWLQQLHSYGLLRGSFRPDHDFVKLRTYLRHRGDLIGERASLIQRMQKALTLSNLHLHLVVTDISGETGMRIIRDIVAGNHDPQLLAKHRHYSCKSTQDEIAEALRGEYRDEHLFMLRQAVDLYDAYGDRLAECDEVLEDALEHLVAKHGAKVQLPAQPVMRRKKRRAKEAQFGVQQRLHHLVGVDLTRVAGLGELSALQLVGEIGVDMSRWKDADHFASWTSLAPTNRITGGKLKSGRRPASASRVAEILRMAAMNAGRTQTAIGAFYRRLGVRASKGKAIVATAAKLARIIYTMIRKQTEYGDEGSDAYEHRYRHRVIRNLQRRAKELGLLLIESEENPAVAGAVS